jgi:acetyl esterase/lipase
MFPPLRATCVLLTWTILSGGASLCLRAQEPSPQDLFDRWDRNRDGRLSRDELPDNLRPNFPRVDTNGDGFLSREEHQAFVARRAPAANGPPGGPRLPDSLRAERDVPYASTDHPRQRLDLYLPREPKSDRLPLIVFIHGGGWRNGDKAGGLAQILPFVRTGEYAGASIGYRLSGDAVWPAQIHDCKAALRWLRAHADQFGLDPDRIGVMGTSAGGHLAAMLGTSGGIEALEGDLGEFRSVSSRVACVVDFFGPADLLTMGDMPGSIDHNAPNSPESLLLGGPVQEVRDRARQASPLSYVSADDPPFLIVHGADDRIVPFDQSVKLDTALRAAGVSSVLIRVEGGGHGGFRNPEINARVRAFFDRQLRGLDVAIPATPLSAQER